MAAIRIELRSLRRKSRQRLPNGDGCPGGEGRLATLIAISREVMWSCRPQSYRAQECQGRKKARLLGVHDMRAAWLVWSPAKS
jgi:hypothetical protein